MTADANGALVDLLTGHPHAHRLRLGALGADDWRRYAQLLTGAFLVAVRRRFVTGQDRAPVIRFVASVRERYDATGHDIDPTTAEALVWAALGERDPLPVDAATVNATTLLLLGLLEDEGLTERERVALLDAAAAYAGL